MPLVVMPRVTVQRRPFALRLVQPRVQPTWFVAKGELPLPVLVPNARAVLATRPLFADAREPTEVP